MNIVLDTNVLVSGLLKVRSDAGVIVRMIAAGSLIVIYDFRILAEYQDVLGRPKFGFGQTDVEALLTQIKAEGILVNAKPLSTPLPDRDDEPFLEAALAAEGAVLVTGNKRHFPLSPVCSLSVFSPGEFISYWRKQTDK